MLKIMDMKRLVNGKSKTSSIDTPSLSVIWSELLPISSTKKI
jgi:hypothetical protein